MNQFTVNTPSYGAGLAGLGNSIAQFAQQRDLKQQQQQQKDHAEQGMEQAKQLMTNGGSPQEIAALSLEYPELGKQLQDNMQFKNESTKANLMETYQSIVSGGDVEKALQSRIAFIADQGGDPSDTIEELQEYRQNPESFVEQKKQQYTFLDKDYASRVLKESGQGSTATSNMKDFERYQELLETNPEQAALFANQAGITQKPKADQNKTQQQQNFDQWSAMEDGPEKTAFAELVGISKPVSAKDERLKEESVDLLSSKVESATDTINQIDEIVNNPALNAAFGVQTIFPTLPGSQVADANAQINQFKNMLTLENLDKMSGVLTDKDIEVLASAASGIEPGMSAEAFTKQANKIKGHLKRSIAKSKAKIKKLGGNDTKQPKQQSTANLSDEDLLLKYGG